MNWERKFTGFLHPRPDNTDLKLENIESLCILSVMMFDLIILLQLKPVVTLVFLLFLAGSPLLNTFYLNGKTVEKDLN